MLVLSRKAGTGITVRNRSTGETVELVILDLTPSRVTVGIDAALHFEITRTDPATPTTEPSAAESR